MKQSYGILLEHRGLYLLCHTSRPNRKVDKYDGWWTIAKGGPNTNETPEETAYREFLEETGIDLLSLGLTIAPYKQYKTKSKCVHVFSCNDVEGKTKELVPVCKSIIPGTKRPEVDSFMWVTREDALQMMIPSQRVIL